MVEYCGDGSINHSLTGSGMEGFVGVVVVWLEGRWRE